MNPPQPPSNNIGVSYVDQNAQTQPVQPQHSGNWFTHLLPTIGSVAAPIIGAALAPETGGLSLLAAAGLSGAGAAAGKAAENATEGKQVLQGNDVTAGLEGLAGGAAGGIAGKALGKGAELLANRGAGLAGKEAAQTGIENLATAYKDVSPQLQGEKGLSDIAKHVQNLGYDPADPANLIKVSDTSNDVLNSTLDKALANSGPVDLSHYPKLVKDALANQADVLDSYEKIALSRGRLGSPNTPAAKLLDAMERLGAGRAKVASDPNEIRTLTTKLGNMAEKYRGSDTPEAKAAYDAINEVRSNVKSALYNRPEVNQALQNLEGNILPTDVGGSENLATHLNGVLSNAGKSGNTPAQDLLSEISRNINMKDLGVAGSKAGQIVSSTGAKARAALDAGLPTGDSGTGGLVSTVASHGSLPSKALHGALHAANNPALLDTLSRLGTLTAKAAPIAGEVAATAPNLGAAPLAGANLTANTTGETMNNAAGGAPDPNNLSSILAQYMHMGTVDPYLLGETSPVVQALAPVVQKQRLASTELSNLEPSFLNAGGAQGTGGVLSRISGLIPGTAAHTYQGQQQAAAQALAGAMGISPAAAAALLPQLMQNQQTAGLSQGILGSLQGQLAY